MPALKKALFIGLLLSLLLAACAPASTPPATPPAIPAATQPASTVVTIVGTPFPTPASLNTTSPTMPPTSIFQDGLNRMVTLHGTPKRIVSLAPSYTEILFALGAGAQVVGRDEFSDYPAEAKSIPSIGGSMGKYNFEQIAALQPDLVLASQLNTPEQVKTLEDLKITVYYLTNPFDLDGLYANLKTVGGLVGKSDAAHALADALQKRVQAVVDAASKQTTKIKVFYELDATDPAKPWTAGPGSYIDTMLKLIGGQNVAAGLKSDYAQISQEDLVAGNPDIILLGDGAYGVTPAQVAARPGWSGISAVKNNRIFTFDDNLVSRPGPRLVDGLEMLYKILHP